MFLHELVAKTQLWFDSNDVIKCSLHGARQKCFSPSIPSQGICASFSWSDPTPQRQILPHHERFTGKQGLLSAGARTGSFDPSCRSHLLKKAALHPPAQKHQKSAELSWWAKHYTNRWPCCRQQRAASAWLWFSGAGARGERQSDFLLSQCSLWQGAFMQSPKGCQVQKKGK